MTVKAIHNFRLVILTKTGVKGFPITHTNQYRQASFIDINNICGRGCNAIFSANGYDKSMFIYVAPSLEEYLRSHYLALKEDRYQLTSPIMQQQVKLKIPEISAFCKNP